MRHSTSRYGPPGGSRGRNGSDNTNSSNNSRPQFSRYGTPLTGATATAPSPNTYNRHQHQHQHQPFDAQRFHHHAPSRPVMFQTPPPLPPHQPPLPLPHSHIMHRPPHTVPMPMPIAIARSGPPQRPPMPVPAAAVTGPMTPANSAAAATGSPSATTNAIAVASADVDIDSHWLEYKDAATGAPYYYNQQTKETVWTIPEAFRIQQLRDQQARDLEAAAAERIAAAQAAAAAKQQQQRTDDAQAAAAFADLSHTERVAAFKAFLIDHNVSPQLKWVDAQKLIVKEHWDRDPRWRFALATTGDRKQSFAEYCSQAAKRQSVMRQQLVKQQREAFLALLAQHEALFAAPTSPFLLDQHQNKRASIECSDKPVVSTISMDDVGSSPHFFAVRQDPRWLAVTDKTEKNRLFATFIDDLERRNAHAAAKQRATVKRAFFECLRAHSDTLGLLTVRRLDTALKQQIWGLVPELRTALRDEYRPTIDALARSDVFDWTDQLLETLRDEAHAARRRQRESQRVAEAQLETRLRAFVETSELTALTSWDDVSKLLLVPEAQQLQEPAVDTNTDTDTKSDQQAAAPNDTSNALQLQLSERDRKRVYETIVAELRAALQPARDVVVSYLLATPAGTNTDTSSISINSSGVAVAATCTYEAFVAALVDGVRARLDAQRPEDGEALETETDTANETAADVSTDSSSSDLVSPIDISNSTNALTPEQMCAQLELAVTTHSSDNDALDVAFPPFVRAVHALLVAIAHETDTKAVAVSASRSTLAATSSGSATLVQAANSSSSSNVQSPLRTHKRRRGSSASSRSAHRRSVSVSRSRSRSRSRGAHRPTRSSRSPSVHRSRSRSPRSRRSYQYQSERRYQLQNSPILDRSVVWNTVGSSGDSSSRHRFGTKCDVGTADPLIGNDMARRRPMLTAEDERMRAEAIIRQARLKLQQQHQDMTATATKSSLDTEIEEGEELEDGEELEA